MWTFIKILTKYNLHFLFRPDTNTDLNLCRVKFFLQIKYEIEDVRYYIYGTNRRSPFIIPCLNNKSVILEYDIVGEKFCY